MSKNDGSEQQSLGWWREHKIGDARRARDAEVEALVAAATPFVALLQAHNEFDHKRNPVSGHQPVFGINDVTIRIGDLRLLRAALLPFLSGDKP